MWIGTENIFDLNFFFFSKYSQQHTELGSNYSLRKIKTALIESVIQKI